MGTQEGWPYSMGNKRGWQHAILAAVEWAAKWRNQEGYVIQGCDNDTILSHRSHLQHTKYSNNFFVTLSRTWFFPNLRKRNIITSSSYFTGDEYQCYIWSDCNMLVLIHQLLIMFWKLCNQWNTQNSWSEIPAFHLCFAAMIWIFNSLLCYEDEGLTSTIISLNAGFHPVLCHSIIDFF